MDQGTKFSQQNISEASRMFWEEVWLERAVLFGFGHLLCFVVESKKSRQVRKRGRKKKCIRNTLARFPSRHRGHGIRRDRRSSGTIEGSGKGDTEQLRHNLQVLVIL